MFKQTLLDLEGKIRQGYVGDLHFDGITQKEFDSLYSKFSPISRRARFLYDSTNRALYVRMPGPRHEDIAQQFKEIINGNLQATGIDRDAFWCSGSPPYTFGGITAEPDGCWGREPDVNPTVIMEVGNSQTSGQLFLDARHWLENVHSSVQLSILVKLNQNPDIIYISIWELDHTRQLRTLRSGTTHRPAKLTQTAKITRGNPNHLVTINSPSAELRIPLAMFTGPSPPGVNIAGDLVISQQDLFNLARRHFVARNGYV